MYWLVHYGMGSHDHVMNHCTILIKRAEWVQPCSHMYSYLTLRSVLLTVRAFPRSTPPSRPILFESRLQLEVHTLWHYSSESATQCRYSTVYTNYMMGWEHITMSLTSDLWTHLFPFTAIMHFWLFSLHLTNLPHIVRLCWGLTSVSVRCGWISDLWPQLLLLCLQWGSP